MANRLAVQYNLEFGSHDWCHCCWWVNGSSTDNFVVISFCRRSHLLVIVAMEHRRLGAFFVFCSFPFNISAFSCFNLMFSVALLSASLVAFSLVHFLFKIPFGIASFFSKFLELLKSVMNRGQKFHRDGLFCCSELQFFIVK